LGALANNDSSNNGTANRNTAVGSFALTDNVNAPDNTAVGANALENNVNSSNTAVGSGALRANTTGSFNSAFGVAALASNLAGDSNNAFGVAALLHTTTGSFANNAFGMDALAANTTGQSNVAMGNNALTSNTMGNFNIATGTSALASNVTGIANTALGDRAGFNVTGGGNTLIGAGAGFALTGGGNNICIGEGVSGIAGESDTTRIADNAAPIGGTTSKVFFGGINAATVGAANAAVLINANGQLGTAPSSARFKKDIESMGRTSEVIYSLRPVTFHYKGDETNTPCSGLIAEEVAKVDPTLILLDKEGTPQTVRYEQINAMLLNEFLKEHKAFVEEQRKVQEQGATIARLQRQIDALTAGLQKVTAQLELSKPAPQTVLNNQ
jgi:hypothetical protein